MGWLDGLLGGGQSTLTPQQTPVLSPQYRSAQDPYGILSGNVGQQPQQPSTMGTPQPSPTSMPSSWQNGLGLFGSTLRDVGANLGGKPQDANNISEFQNHVIGMNVLRQRQQAISDFANAKTPQEKQAAALKLWSIDPQSAAGLATSLKVGQPELRDMAPGSNLAVIDPSTGLPTNIIKGTPKVITSQGMQSMDGGQTWQQIPGYSEQQGSISDARAAGRAAHPMPSRKAAAPGAINIPHPGGMY